MDKDTLVYRIEDGRLYDVALARFVDTATPGKDVMTLYQAGKPAGMDYLRRTLVFYGYPVGVELKTLEEVQTEQRTKLNASMQELFASGHLTSSVGFEINADNDANRNIGGLITSLEASGAANIQFMDYTNTLRTVTLENLKTMQLELIQWAQAAYARKWTVRAAIDGAKTVDACAAVQWDAELNLVANAEA